MLKLVDQITRQAGATLPLNRGPQSWLHDCTGRSVRPVRPARALALAGNGPSGGRCGAGPARDTYWWGWRAADPCRWSAGPARHVTRRARAVLFHGASLTALARKAPPGPSSLQCNPTSLAPSSLACMDRSNGSGTCGYPLGRARSPSRWLLIGKRHYRKQLICRRPKDLPMARE